MSILRTFDDYTLGLRQTASAYAEAVRHGDQVGALHASMEHTNGYATAVKYSAEIGEKAVMIAGYISEHMPFDSAEKSVLHILQGLTSLQVLAGIGTVISGITVVTQVISIHRENEVLSVIDDRDISTSLDALDKVNYNHLKTALPEHLKTEIEELGGKEAFSALKTDAVFAKTMVEKIQDYASRKRIFHMVALMGAFVSLVASIGIFVGFPPLALIVLAVIGLSFAIGAVLIQKGWVENPKDGFDWKLILPAFLRNKSKAEEEVEMHSTTAQTSF